MKTIESKDQFKCPNCGSRSDAIYEKESSPATYIISVIAVVFLGLWSILVIPLIVQATKTIVKRCYDCNSVMEKHDLFSIPSFNDQILNFRFGSCAIILSRKYAYAILILIFLTYLYITNYVIEPQAQVEEQPISFFSWEHYIQDCGKDQYINNGMKAKSNFQKKYEEKLVNWEGVYIELRENKNLLDISQKYFIYVKMIPTETVIEYPDIVLTLSSQVYQEHEKIIKQLSYGQLFQFKGQFVHMGDEWSYHLIKLQQLQINDANKTVEVDKIITYRQMIELQKSNDTALQTNATDQS